MFKILIVATALMAQNALAAEGEVYIRQADVKAGMTKAEAGKLLLTSDNKEQVLKCQLVEITKKLTIKNK